METKLCFWRSVTKSFENTPTRSKCLDCDGLNTECREYREGIEKDGKTIIKGKEVIKDENNNAVS